MPVLSEEAKTTREKLFQRQDERERISMTTHDYRVAVNGGNTGKAALDLKRRFIGCDYSERWVALAREQIRCRPLELFAA